MGENIEEPYEVRLVRKELNTMRGRLCGLIESWGLPERQERGAIATLKSLSYESERVIAEMVEELVA